jgi:hypothetical protein
VNAPFLLPVASNAAHVPLPTRGTFRRESDGIPLDRQVKKEDYPLAADCIGCEFNIRKESPEVEWKHPEPEKSFIVRLRAVRLTLIIGLGGAMIVIWWWHNSSTSHTPER